MKRNLCRFLLLLESAVIFRPKMQAMSGKHLFAVLMLLFITPVFAQVEEDDDDDFDFSEFELAAPPSKSFCNNKVLGQIPTTLVGFNYDLQFPHDLSVMPPIGGEEFFPEQTAEISPAQAFNFQGNFPIVSRNNILINLNTLFHHQSYAFSGDDSHPLMQSLGRHGLTRSAVMGTVFKPLNDRHFILAQVGAEVNGDYVFSEAGDLIGSVRLPAAVLFGWKPHDRLMYAFGLSRTYIGGALNYVPVIYYYHTFKNQKWGVEALLPARGALRYRFNSLSVLLLGFNATGASYSLNSFDNYAQSFAPPQQGELPGFPDMLNSARNVELRRSELRLGLTFQRSLVGFFWLTLDAGYRVNWSYGVDQGGDFLRFFGDNTPYFLETDLRNTPYISVGISYMSP